MHVRRVFGAIAFALVLCCGFSSCLLAEKFTCSISIKADGSYTLAFKGTAVDYRVLGAIKEGTFTEQDQESLIQEYKKSDYFSVVRNAGNGRMYIEYTQSASDGAPLAIFEGFTLIKVYLESGAIAVTISGAEEGLKGELVSLGYKIDGTLTITSEIPAEKTGNSKVNKKGVVYSIKKTFKELPTNEEILTFSNDATRKMKGPDTMPSVRVSDDWLE